MKTLTSIGIQKIGQRFVDSVDHAAYTLNGVPQTVEPFRRFVPVSYTHLTLPTILLV